MAGNVLANDNRIDTPGQMVCPTNENRIKGINRRYVSKDGLKLEGALSDFNINVEGVAAIDSGASTGGLYQVMIT